MLTILSDFVKVTLPNDCSFPFFPCPSYLFSFFTILITTNLSVTWPGIIEEGSGSQRM